MSKKVIGILGGMGPLATADLFQKITLHTVAACDQAHPRVCIDSNTDIADRTAALLHGGEDPVPEMIKSAKRLESIGADFLIMPCNTAHNYYEQVCEAVTIPVLHMIALTRDALKERGVKCAGLLATDGTVQTGIYQRTFAGSGVDLLTPDDPADQAAADAQEREDKSDNDVGHRIFLDPESEECQGPCDKCVDNAYAEPEQVSMCAQNESQRADGGQNGYDVHDVLRFADQLQRIVRLGLHSDQLPIQELALCFRVSGNRITALGTGCGILSNFILATSTFHRGKFWWLVFLRWKDA